MVSGGLVVGGWLTVGPQGAQRLGGWGGWGGRLVGGWWLVDGWGGRWGACLTPSWTKVCWVGAGDFAVGAVDFAVGAVDAWEGWLLLGRLTWR